MGAVASESRRSATANTNDSASSMVFSTSSGKRVGPLRDVACRPDHAPEQRVLLDDLCVASGAGGRRRVRLQRDERALSADRVEQTRPAQLVGDRDGIRPVRPRRTSDGDRLEDVTVRRLVEVRRRRGARPRPRWRPSTATSPRGATLRPGDCAVGTRCAAVLVRRGSSTALVSDMRRSLSPEALVRMKGTSMGIPCGREPELPTTESRTPRRTHVRKSTSEGERTRRWASPLRQQVPE